MEVKNSSPYKRRRVTVASPENSSENSPVTDLRLADPKEEENTGNVTPKRDESSFSGEKFTKVPPKTPRKKKTPPANIDWKNVQAHFVPDGVFEQFFAKSFEAERVRCITKYNFDVVKDEPVEGNYEWIPLK